MQINSVERQVETMSDIDRVVALGTHDGAVEVELSAQDRSDAQVTRTSMKALAQ